MGTKQVERTMAPDDDASRPERKSDRTRRRILDAAADILSRKGFDGTRVSEIATVAKLRVPTIYYYFDSREALLEEVVNLGGRLAIDNVKACLAAQPATATPMDRLCAAFGAHLEALLRDSAYAAAAMRTMGQLPPDLRRRQLEQQRLQAQTWRDLIASAAENGEIDPGLDLRAARMFLLGAVNWAPEWWSPSRGSLHDTVATIERLVRNALGARNEGTTPAGS